MDVLSIRAVAFRDGARPTAGTRFSGVVRTWDGDGLRSGPHRRTDQRIEVRLEDSLLPSCATAAAEAKRRFERLVLLRSPLSANAQSRLNPLTPAHRARRAEGVASRRGRDGHCCDDDFERRIGDPRLKVAAEGHVSSGCLADRLMCAAAQKDLIEIGNPELGKGLLGLTL